MPNAIELNQVRKTFGKKVAVEGMDLVVPDGALHGFIGPNGAGKTTTIRMIMAILFPDSGSLSVLGRSSAVESKDRIGYLPEERGVYKKMKVAAFLAHMGKLKGLHGKDMHRKIGWWLERVNLADVARKRCEELSKGMQQKVQFISSVLHEPDLLILDEPFSGLDPVNMRLLRDLFLEQHNQGRTVIFSTHVMHQAESLCDHVVMINQGRKVLDTTIDDARRQFDANSISFKRAPGAEHHDLAGIPGVREIQQADDTGTFHLELGADTATVIREAASRAPLEKIEVNRPTLEDIFIDIVQGDASNADDEAKLRASLREEASATQEVNQ